MAAVIDVEEVFYESGTVYEAREASWFVRLWIGLRRRVRRLLASGRRGFNRMLSHVPVWMLRSLVWAAAFVGYMTAWMIFYIVLIIAFSYGLIWGFAVTFVFVWLVVSIFQLFAEV